VYDITDRESLKNTRNWMRQIEQNCTRQIDLILLGNKSDMQKQRLVTIEEGRELAEEFGIPFFETSAKNDFNITEAFHRMAQDVIARGVSIKGKKILYLIIDLYH